MRLLASYRIGRPRAPGTPSLVSVLDTVPMPRSFCRCQLIYFGTVALSLEARIGAALAVFVYLNLRPNLTFVACPLPCMLSICLF